MKSWKWKEWAKEEEETLKKYYRDMPKEELLKLLPGRSWHSIAARASKLGIKRKPFPGVKWTKEEDSILTQNYHRPSEELLKLLPRRNWNAIKIRAKKLGLGLRPCYWRKEETELLQKMYCSSPKDEIMKALPRWTWLQIQNKARRMGLKRLEIVRMEELVKKAIECVSQLSEVEKAYIAGIIDGEGTIGISKYHPHTRKRPYFVTYFLITNTSKELIDWLNVRIWGITRRVRVSSGRLGKRTVYRIGLCSKKGAVLLKAILPYLIVKKKHAELFLKLVEIKMSKPRGETCKEEFEIWEQMRELKKTQS